MAGETSVEETTDPTEDTLVDDASFERMLNFLQDSRSFDFTGYKRPSLMRRIRHQMREIGIESFDDYQDMQLEPREFTALFNTILINVTSFFRDADAWDRLRTGCAQTLEASNGGRFGSGALDAQPVRRRTRSPCCSTKQWAAAGSGSDTRPTSTRTLNHARQASCAERRRVACRLYRDRYSTC
jgi:hypothetical protein